MCMNDSMCLLVHSDGPWMFLLKVLFILPFLSRSLALVRLLSVNFTGHLNWGHKCHSDGLRPVRVHAKGTYTQTLDLECFRKCKSFEICIDFFSSFACLAKMVNIQ